MEKVYSSDYKVIEPNLMCVDVPDTAVQRGGFKPIYIGKDLDVSKMHIDIDDGNARKTYVESAEPFDPTRPEFFLAEVYEQVKIDGETICYISERRLYADIAVEWYNLYHSAYHKKPLQNVQHITSIVDLVKQNLGLCPSLDELHTLCMRICDARVAWSWTESTATVMLRCNMFIIVGDCPAVHQNPPMPKLARLFDSNGHINGHTMAAFLDFCEKHVPYFQHIMFLGTCSDLAAHVYTLFYGAYHRLPVRQPSLHRVQYRHVLRAGLHGARQYAGTHPIKMAIMHLYAAQHSPPRTPTSIMAAMA